MRWKAAIPVLPLLLLALLVLPLLQCGGTVPTLTEAEKNCAIVQITGDALVQDAAVTQGGRQLSLVLIVDYATSEAYAKELGDRFVRLVKSCGPEPAPSQDIGEGTFDYLIGVYYPDVTLIAMGAKVSSSEYITW